MTRSKKPKRGGMEKGQGRWEVGKTDRQRKTLRDNTTSREPLCLWESPQGFRDGTRKRGHGLRIVSEPQDLAVLSPKGVLVVYKTQAIPKS